MSLFWKLTFIGMLGLIVSTDSSFGGEGRNTDCDVLFEVLGPYNISAVCNKTDCQQIGGISECLKKVSQALPANRCGSFKKDMGILCAANCGQKTGKSCYKLGCEEMCCLFNRDKIWRPCGDCSKIAPLPACAS